jgi:hypothetical protein
MPFWKAKSEPTTRPSGPATVPDDDVVGPAGIERMLRAHLERLQRVTRGNPGSEGLRSLSEQLLAEPMLSYAVSAIGARLPASRACASDGRSFSDWYVAVTVCDEIDPGAARAGMRGGYLALMNEVTAPAWAEPGGRNVAHWIYCCSGEKLAGVHLTMIPNPNRPRISPPLIAQDFLTPAEASQLHINSAG